MLDMDIVFLCKPMIAWYHEHLRVYELTQSSIGLVATKMTDFIDVFPLSVYQVRGKLFVSLKRCMLC